MNNIKELISFIESDILNIRRTLHQHPELSNQEYQTSALVKEKLTEYGIEFQTGFANTGVLGIIQEDIREDRSAQSRYGCPSDPGSQPA